METETTHYSNFGCSQPPRCADREGYLHYRNGYESLPRGEWTDAERWIDDMTRSITAWRQR